MTTPLIMVNNLFDRVGQYPTATLSASSEVVGREVRRVADYRRERSWWQATDDGVASTPAGNWMKVDLGAVGAQPVDYLWLDRGHNQNGATVVVQGSDDDITYQPGVTRTIPSLFTVGGDPTLTTMAATEEGCNYTLFGQLAPRRYWRILFPYTAGSIPVITGVMLGLRSQFYGYATVYDEDAGERTQSAQTSDAGYRASVKTYSWHRVQLSFTNIGSQEYDSSIRVLKSSLFAGDQPFALVMDYENYPERSWLFKYDGAAWGAPKTRVHRSHSFFAREVGAAVI